MPNGIERSAISSLGVREYIGECPTWFVTVRLLDNTGYRLFSCGCCWALTIRGRASKLECREIHILLSASLSSILGALPPVDLPTGIIRG